MPRPADAVMMSAPAAPLPPAFHPTSPPAPRPPPVSPPAAAVTPSPAKSAATPSTNSRRWNTPRELQMLLGSLRPASACLALHKAAAPTPPPPLVPAAPRGRSGDSPGGAFCGSPVLPVAALAPGGGPPSAPLPPHPPSTPPIQPTAQDPAQMGTVARQLPPPLDPLLCTTRSSASDLARQDTVAESQVAGHRLCPSLVVSPSAVSDPVARSPGSPDQAQSRHSATLRPRISAVTITTTGTGSSGNSPAEEKAGLLLSPIVAGSPRSQGSSALDRLRATASGMKMKMQSAATLLGRMHAMMSEGKGVAVFENVMHRPPNAAAETPVTVKVTTTTLLCVPRGSDRISSRLPLHLVADVTQQDNQLVIYSAKPPESNSEAGSRSPSVSPRLEPGKSPLEPGKSPRSQPSPATPVGDLLSPGTAKLGFTRVISMARISPQTAAPQPQSPPVKLIDLSTIPLTDCDKHILICPDEQVLDDLYTAVMRQQVKALHAQLFRANKFRRPKGNRVLEIVHYNDVYHLPVVKTDEPRGGASRFYQQLEILRESKNPLVLFSGDFVGPSLMSVITRGKQMVDCMNFIGTHFGCFGNHEFDFGLRNFERVIHGYTQGEYIFAGSQTQWLSTNIDGADGLPLANTLREKLISWNGIRIGLIGLCENWLPHCPRLAKGEACYADIFEVGEEVAKSLKNRGAEIVLALTHNRLAQDKEVTARCPSIDLLLGGHDHFYKKDLSNRLVKSGEEFQWMSEITITVPDVDAEGTKVPPLINCKSHAISSELPENMLMNKLVLRYGEKMTEKMGKPVGRTTVSLDSTEEACRFQEGHLTNFLADVMEDETGCDCAVIGGAAVSGKSVLRPGVITIGDIFNWFPHETKVQTVEMTGAMLDRMLNVSVREVPEEAPSFPHPSRSLSFSLNCLVHPPIVTDVRVKGEPVDPEGLYTVALTDFVAAGKERFKFIIQENAKILIDAENAEQLSMWVLDYFRNKKGQQQRGSALDQECVAGADDPALRLSKSESEAEMPLRNAPGTMAHSPRRQGTIAGRFRWQPRRSTGVGTEDDYDVDLDTIDDHPILHNMDNDTLKKLMVAFGHLAEEARLLEAQRYVAGAVKELLHCDGAVIYTVDHAEQTLHFLAGCLAMDEDEGEPQEQLKEHTEVIPMLGTIAGICARLTKPINVPDCRSDERCQGTADCTHRNMLLVPVMGKTPSQPGLPPPVIAVLQATDKDPQQGPFNARDEKILTLFGRQAGIHLQNAQQHEELRQNLEGTRGLLYIAKEVASETNMSMKDMVKKIQAGGSQLLRVDTTLLFLVDIEAGDEGEGEMWTIYDDSAGKERIVRVPLSSGVSGHVAMNDTVVCLRHAYDSPYFNPALDRKMGYETRQLLCCPVSVSSGDVLGAVQFMNKVDGQPFSAADVELAKSFASFAGITIANSQEIDMLRLQQDDSLLQELPVPTLGRIRLKAGWATVRHHLRLGSFKELANAERLISPRGLRAIPSGTCPSTPSVGTPRLQRQQLGTSATGTQSPRSYHSHQSPGSSPREQIIMLPSVCPEVRMKMREYNRVSFAVSPQDDPELAGVERSDGSGTPDKELASFSAERRRESLQKLPEPFWLQNYKTGSMRKQSVFRAGSMRKQSVRQIRRGSSIRHVCLRSVPRLSVVTANMSRASTVSRPSHASPSPSDAPLSPPGATLSGSVLSPSRSGSRPRARFVEQEGPREPAVAPQPSAVRSATIVSPQSQR
eukprot:TRINITY_DN1137_c1_g1_i1.p1 TRINITY_DN1137_c1_g1~~TRINITY_DN1137_c1_g1_i1.p1  ORF type:complete len:1726 (+),score=510.42 TRINITY_DN1137_c1_g1_i1:103-5280(+)